MFYRPEQSGWNKTMACRHYCSELNPDTIFEVHNINIATEENRQKLKETVSSGSLDRKSSVSMIIGCVDNWEARQVLEAVCEELQVPFTPSLPPSPPSSSPPLSPPPSPSPPLPPLPYLLARGSDATFHPRAPVVRVRFVARAG